MDELKRNPGRKAKKTAKVIKASSVVASAQARGKAKASPSSGKTPVSPEERHRLVQEAAYYLAEKSGFHGDPHQHWVQAEKDVQARLSGKKAK